jgi:hypothetical protein
MTIQQKLCQPKNHRRTTRKREGNLRQGDEDVSYHGMTMLLTTTPEAHDGHLDDQTHKLYAPN